MSKRIMLSASTVCLLAALTFSPGAKAEEKGRGPSMIIAAAQEAAEADGMIAECRYDEAEHWIKEATKAAKEARSDSPLERDIAGIAVGQMAVKLESFQRQRKAWDRAATEVRRLLAENHPEAARRVLDEVEPPPCDPRFRELRSEVGTRNGQAAAWVSKGDEQAVRFPRTARSYYAQAQSIDPDWPGLREKLLDVERRIPDFCADCATKK